MVFGIRVCKGIWVDWAYEVPFQPFWVFPHLPTHHYRIAFNQITTVMNIIGKIDLDNSTTIEQVTMFKLFDGRNHRFVVNHQISEDTALRLQKELSYHPAGYGFYGFYPTPQQTEWFCYGSCD